MAIQTNYLLKVSYNGTVSGNFLNILTEEQRTELRNAGEQGFLIPNTYCVITAIDGDKNLLRIRVDVYKNSTKQDFVASKIYDLVPDLESPNNFIKQGYLYIKTLPEFAGAIDC